jgi:hypothetical protein
LAITAHAAVSEAYSQRCTRTHRTVRSLTAASIFFGMLPILLHQIQAARKPYRFTEVYASRRGHHRIVESTQPEMTN